MKIERVLQKLVHFKIDVAHEFSEKKEAKTDSTNIILTQLFSALYIDGVKLGDTQATFSAMTIAGAFLFITRSKPIEKLSAQRPQSTIFTFSTFLSLIGQFLIHFVVLITAVRLAKEYSPGDEVCRMVIFYRVVRSLLDSHFLVLVGSRKNANIRVLFCFLN